MVALSPTLPPAIVAEPVLPFAVLPPLVILKFRLLVVVAVSLTVTVAEPVVVTVAVLLELAPVVLLVAVSANAAPGLTNISDISNVLIVSDILACIVSKPFLLPLATNVYQYILWYVPSKNAIGKYPQFPTVE